MEIKRANYNQKAGEIFNIKEIDGQLVLFDDNEIRYNGKLELEYENGQLHSEGMIRLGLKDGQWKTYYQNNQVKIIENFILGKREGMYEEFYKENIKKLELNYKNDVFYGKYKRYFKTGEIELEGFYRDGLKEGKWISYHQNGNIYSKANYVHDKIEGKSIIYSESGNKKYELNFVNGKKNGEMKEFLENGNLKLVGNYKDDFEEGNWFEYNEETGKIKEKYEMKNNKKNGIYKIYYTNFDEKEITNQENIDETGVIYEIYNMKNDKEEGEYKQFYLNGKLREKKFFKDGKIEGKRYFFPENENFVYESLYENNKLINEKRYYNNKEKKVFSEEFFKYNGKNIFRVIYHFDKKLNIIRKNIFLNKNLLEQIEYDENGNIIYSKKYRKRFSSEEELEFDLEAEKNFFEIFNYLPKIKQGKDVEKLKLENILQRVRQIDKDEMLRRIKDYLKENKIEMVKFNDGSLRTNEHVLEFFEENLNKYVEIERKKNNIEKKEEMVLDKISDDDRKILIQPKETKITQEQIAKKEADKKFDETRNWLGSRTERTLYKGSVFPVSRFIERIKDFDTDLKERVYRFIDSYTKDWISTITFDTGETYELEEALKKFREIMGLPKEEK